MVLPVPIDHEAPEAAEEAPRKSAWTRAWTDPDAPAVRHMIAAVVPACTWLASVVGVAEVIGKDGTQVDVDVNTEESKLEQKMRLSEPSLWEDEFPPEAEREGMMKEMNSMKKFEVYDEVKIEDCTEEQINEALDCRWVKVWKDENELRCKLVVRGCFQNVEKSEEDNQFASTPWLVTMRLLLCMAMARNWGIALGDVSASLRAAMSGEVFIWPPKEFYPDGRCLRELKKARYIWSSASAETERPRDFPI